MTTFSVAVGTYGDGCWAELAQKAVASAWEQTVKPLDVVHVHGQSLDKARNSAVHTAMGEWIINLDADDELDPGYIEAMTARVNELPDGDFLLQPATLGIYADGREDDYPVVIPAKPSILEGNWMVIGTSMRRSQFLRLGGFVALPAWEDWHLMIRAVGDGAVPVTVPGAVYRVFVREGSRNDLGREEAGVLYRRIRQEFMG